MADDARRRGDATNEIDADTRDAAQPAGTQQSPNAAPAEQASAPRTDEPPTLQIDQLREEIEAAKDRELRALAELDNYRKRIARQLDEERRYAGLPLMRDMLPVLDNLKRAVDAAEKTHDAASLLEGVQLVLKQFYSVLERHHCRPIESLHGPFDPNLHEAVLQQPSEEFPENTVLHEVLPGFRLHDRVVRPSQVVVSTDAREWRAAGSAAEGANKTSQDGNDKK